MDTHYVRVTKINGVTLFLAVCGIGDAYHCWWTINKDLVSCPQCLEKIREFNV